MNTIKIAKTTYPVLDVIKNRWSARAFSSKDISDEELNTLFEAASWAASANNEQSWQYIYAKKGTEAFDTIWNCLLPGNQPWAKHAAALIVAVARKTFEANNTLNAYAGHDLGMANAHLLLQARAMNIYCHPMAGFNKIKLTENLNLSENQDAFCVIATGFLAEAETLEEPFKTRELTARKRKNISEFTFQL
jgi:nitroreductase